MVILLMVTRRAQSVSAFGGAMRADNGLRQVAQGHAAQSSNERTLACRRVRANTALPLWTACDSREPLIGHARDCGAHPGWSMCGGAVMAQSEQSSRTLPPKAETARGVTRDHQKTGRSAQTLRGRHPELCAEHAMQPSPRCRTARDLPWRNCEGGQYVHRERSARNWSKI